MKKKVMLSVLLLPLLQLAAQQPDAEQIMLKARELSLAGSLRANVRLTITEKGGATRDRTISMTTKSYFGGQEKRLIRFMEPADVRGTAMLIIDNEKTADEMWIYLPALKKIRRIVSSDKGKSFMSSEFSNADISSPPITDFVHRHVDNSGRNNTWIIESTPVSEDKADEYGYSRKISYISMDKSQVQKMEFYNFDNELFKVIEIRSVLPLPEGRYLVNDMLASNMITNRKSELFFSNVSEGSKIEDNYFSLQNLER